jgi:SAM-dependent methyltransferase
MKETRMRPSFYSRLKLKIRSLLGIKTAHEYQERRFPQEKFNLLYNSISDPQTCKTLLDIGCNAGKITSIFADKGFFAVGVDINPRIIDYEENKRPIMGYYPIDLQSVSKVHHFDIVLLLSVHHQWVRDQSEAYAQELIASIIGKAKRYMFIEFASILEKYGYTTARFEEGNEASLKLYCEAWLNDCRKFTASSSADFKFEYIGRNKERAGVEEFRYIYKITK